MSLRPDEINRKAVEAYRRRSATHAQSNDQDDRSVLCKANEAVEFGDWVACSTNTEGHPSISLPADDGDIEWIGVVMSDAASGEWCRVLTCGAVIAKVDTGTSFNAGDWLTPQSGDGAAKLWEDEKFRAGRFLYYLGASGNGIAMVHLSGDGTSTIDIHHHTTEDNTQWVDRTSGGTPLIGLSYHLFKVNKDAYTGGADRLMLAVGGNATHGETNKEGMAWGGVIGTNAATGRGYLGGNESAGKQGPLGLEEDDTDSQHSGKWRVNIRSYAGYNSRDKFTYAGGKVGPLLYINPTESASYSVPVNCRTATPTTPCAGNGVEWWSGAILWDSASTPNNGTGWAGFHVPALPIEIDCCTTFNDSDEPTVPDCEIVTGRTNFKTNTDDLNGNYEWVIPYGWTATTGRQSVLHAICCHSRHIGEIWNFLQRLSYWVGQYASCNDAFFATKLDGVGTASSCCEDTGDILVPSLDCGPVEQGVDCDGNPISG